MTVTSSAASSRRISPWRADGVFCRLAWVLWPRDYQLATSGGYDGGASQRLLWRWQGWLARGDEDS